MKLQDNQIRRPKVWSRNCVDSSKSFFPSDTINSAAFASGAFQRVRKLKPLSLVTSLAFFRGDTIGYEDLAAETQVQTGINISAQAISDKVKKSDTLFQVLTAAAITRSKLLPTSPTILIPGVADVHIADASTIALKKSLAQLLPGTGGNGPVASAKIHALFNATSQTFSHLALSEGKASDHGATEAHFECTKPQDLILRDLGYFDVAELRRLDQGKRYFVSRIPLSLTNFRQPDGPLLDPWEWLAKSRMNVVDQILIVGGTEQITARVVALKLPKDKRDERIANMRLELGRKLTEREKAQASWNLIVTNLSDRQASAETLVKIYAVRWQIEILFKALKSCLAVDKISSASSAAVVKAFVWARLLAAALLMTARALVVTQFSGEIGILKWFRRVAGQLARIRDLIQTNRWLALAKWFTQVGRKCCLQSEHSKPSTIDTCNESSQLDQKLWAELLA